MAAATGETTSTTTTMTAAPTVRFSDEPEIYHPEEIPAPVSTGAGKRGRRSSRRRNHVQQKTQEDLIETFANQLTFPILATEVKRYVPQLISGVPNNGRVYCSPASYCSDCVDRIAAYFESENLAKYIMNGVEEQVCNIKDFKKLATLFLSVQHLQFYDHVTVEAFNNNAMEKGGSMYGVPLSMACLSDAACSGNLYEKLAGKETVCAAFSTGVAMQCGTSKLTALSENNFKTHKQLLEENVDPNKIRSSCSCLKSDEWLQKREKEVNRLTQKNKKVCNRDETKEEGEEEMNHEKEKVKKHSEKEDTNKKEEAEKYFENIDSEQSKDDVHDSSDFRPDETKEEGEEEMNHEKEEAEKYFENIDSEQSKDDVHDSSDFRPDETKEEGEEEMNHEKEEAEKYFENIDSEQSKDDVHDSSDFRPDETKEEGEEEMKDKKEEAEKYFENIDSEQSEDDVHDSSDFRPDETKEEGEEEMNHEKEKAEKYFENIDSEQSEDDVHDSSDFRPDETKEEGEEEMKDKKEEAEKYFENIDSEQSEDDVDDSSDFRPDETKEEGEEEMNHEKEKVNSEKEDTNKKEEAEKYFENIDSEQSEDDVDDSSDFRPDETKEEGEEEMNHEKEKVNSEKEDTNKKEEAEKYFENIDSEQSKDDVHDSSDFRPDETKEEGKEEMNHEKWAGTDGAAGHPWRGGASTGSPQAEEEEEEGGLRLANWALEQSEDVDDSDFRPGNFVQPVEKEEDFDNERWSNMRTTSACLALCRHAESCVVNAINKARVLENLILVRSKNKKEGIASTTPEEEEEEEFTVFAHPEKYLIFSLGATVYEALAYRCDDDDFWNMMEEGRLVSSKKTIAKVYTTVHTVAAPLLKSAPVCHIDQQNKYGYYKTFRIRFPGNFSGYYNDTSIGWRSELYSHITASAAQAECRGDKKSHSSFSEGAWPRREPFRIEGGIVYDDSGDKSGNYLTSLYDGFFGISGVSEREEKMTAVIAYTNIRHLTAVVKDIKEGVGELLTGAFKQQLVKLKTEEIKRNQTEETTAHETQRLNDDFTNMAESIKTTAQTIEMYEKCLKSLELDLGTMNKYLSYNLKGYTAAAAAAYDNDNAYYL
nr:MAG: wsv260-like protein [Chiromantes dehaani nimavirus]